MRKTTLLFLLVASLAGCPTSNNNRDTGSTPPNDAYVGGVDTGVPGIDSGTPGMDAGTMMATDVPIASVVNGSAADHPADMTGLVTHVTGDLVALTPRLYISQSAPPAMRCLYAVWVGTAAGGHYSGIEVTETFAAPDNGCFDAPPGHIPGDIAIGDSVTNLVGHFENFCSMAGTCPANTAQEFDITNGSMTVGAHATDPTPTVVTIADIAGVGLTNGPHSLEFQGALVTIENVVLTTPPNATNHNVMSVAASGSTTPVMPIQVSKYPGVGCQRTVLTGMAAGATVGSITGVLQYSFGQWTIQPRHAEDIPSIVCPDGGTSAPDAGL